MGRALSSFILDFWKCFNFANALSSVAETHRMLYFRNVRTPCDIICNEHLLIASTKFSNFY